MNFKKFFLCALLFLCGCGVKAKPLKPPEKAVQSYIETYTGTTEEKKATTPPPALDKKK